MAPGKAKGAQKAEMSELAAHEGTSEEKLLAGLAYLLGLIPAVIIWALKKDDSPEVGFHALQAVLYDVILGLIVLILLGFQVLILGFVLIFSWVGTNLIADFLAPELPFVYLLFPLLMMLILLAGVGLMALLLFGLKVIDIVAGISIFIGKPWRYPIIAGWADKINQQESAES